MAGKHRAEAQEREAGQEERISGLESQQQAPPPAAPRPDAGGISSQAVERLEQLGKLREQGVLTDEEFAQEKAKVLAG
jgi:hypothetical protein